MKHLLAILTTVILASSLSAYTHTCPQKWQKLGSKTVSYKLDRDVIKVDRADGTFKGLKVVVTNGDLNMHKMKVVYRNGTSEVITIKAQFSKRSTSRLIDLKGGKRAIKEIIFWYDTKNLSNSRATVHVLGRH